MSGATGQQSPLACDMAALDPEQRRRHEDLWKRVEAISSGPLATSDGIAYRMARDVQFASELTELAALEQLCCPFLRMSVTFEPEDGELLLELRGHEEVREFLDQELGAS